MSTPIKPSQLAQALDLDGADFCEACRRGEAEYAGYPIGDWLVHDSSGVRLNVPDKLLEHHGVSRGNARSNPSGNNGSNPSVLEPLTDQGQTTMADAVKDTAAPVSANAGAAYTMGRFAPVVRDHPEIMDVIMDGVVIIGSGGVGLAATDEGEDYRAAKVGGTMLASFAVWKLLRYWTNQGDRRTDMAERQQRAEIQENRQRRQQPQRTQRRRGDSVPQPTAVEIGR